MDGIRKKNKTFPHEATQKHNISSIYLLQILPINGLSTPQSTNPVRVNNKEGTRRTHRSS